MSFVKITVSSAYLMLFKYSPLTLMPSSIPSRASRKINSEYILNNSGDNTIGETYQNALYNLIYADLGINYAKYFNTNAGIWGINAGIGIKGNVTANKLAKSTIQLSAFNRSVDMILDNDNFLGYANLSGSYVLKSKNFDMEFSLAYYGNFGDRIISNGGGFEWRASF